MPVTPVVVSWPCGGKPYQTVWSLEGQPGSSSGLGLPIQSRGDENSSVSALFLPAGLILEPVSGWRVPKQHMLLASPLLFLLTLSCLRFGEYWCVLLCRVSPQWRSSGKTSTGKWDCGAVLCAQPFSPLIWSLLYLSFFSLPPSLIRSVPPPTSLCQQAQRHARTHTHKRMSEYTLTWTLSLSLSLSLSLCLSC